MISAAPLGGAIVYKDGLVFVVIDTDDLIGEGLGIFPLHFAELLGGQVILGKEELGVGDGAVEQMRYRKSCWRLFQNRP